MPPKFLYFDLGNVLVTFTLERMFAQMAEVAGIEPAVVREVLLHGGLEKRYELGEITGREFYEIFCERTGTRPDYDELEYAACDIFKINASMLPIVTRLREAGWPIGLLSNTCEGHWEFCRRRFRIVGEGFDVHVPSFRVGVMKPDAGIYHAAAELAGCRPGEIFFVDDREEHVAGAREFGFDAVQYTSTRELVTQLRQRGVRFNY